MSGMFGGASKPVTSNTPVVSGLRVSTTVYGKPIPLVYGRGRVSGNLIWAGDFKTTAHTSSTSAGGKGGHSGSATSTSYSYSASMAIAFCEGFVTPSGLDWSMWLSKLNQNSSVFGFATFVGDNAQNPWGYLSTNYPAQALSYRGTAYAAIANYDLGNSAAFPNISAEVMGRLAGAGTGTSWPYSDVNPSYVLYDILQSPESGIGLDTSLIGDLTAMQTYCQAQGLFVSPVYDTQTAARDMLTNLCTVANTAPFFSAGKLKLVPQADFPVTGNGVTYTPNMTPQYYLGDDDYIVTSPDEDPIKCTRKSVSDLYNDVQVNYLDRQNAYNSATAEAQDQRAIEAYGDRIAPVADLKEICDGGIARTVAQLMLQRYQFVRNTYEFRLGWRYALLEPMDIVALTDSGLGLNNAPVRIITIEEDELGTLTITAEELPIGSLNPSPHAQQGNSGYVISGSVDPGNTSTPVIFEPPVSLTGGTPEVWISAAGGPNWAKANVWVSTDNQSYKMVGQILAPARYGTLTAALPSGSSPDTTNTLAVDLTVSNGTLTSGTQQNATDLLTLCYCDGELLAYETATLTATSKYNLTYLVRGAYGTAIGSHASGAQFARLDEAPFQFAYDPSWVGRTIYIKLQSVNAFGQSGASQALSNLTPVTYNIVGAPSEPVTGFQLAQPWVGGAVKLVWAKVYQAIGYQLKIFHGSTLLRTVNLGAVTAYQYSWDDGLADGGPYRSLTFQLWAVTQNGISNTYSALTVSNPQLGALSGISLQAGISSIFFSCTTPTAADYAGIQIFASTSSSFTPGPGNIVYDGPQTSVGISQLNGGVPIAGGTTYYIIAGAYDVFGKDGMSFSGPLAVTPITVAGGLTPGSITDIMIASMSASKLAGQITTTQITDNAISTPKLQAGSVTGTNITGYTITGYNIQGLTITGDKVAANTITGTNIAANTITASNLYVNQLSAITANMGTLTAGRVQNSANTNFIDFNASGSTTAFQFGSALTITAAGTATFAGNINTSGQVYASGSTVPPGPGIGHAAIVGVSPSSGTAGTYGETSNGGVGVVGFTYTSAAGTGVGGYAQGTSSSVGVVGSGTNGAVGVQATSDTGDALQVNGKLNLSNAKFGTTAATALMLATGTVGTAGSLVGYITVSTVGGTTYKVPYYS